MSSWTNDELDRIGAADELRITTTRRDGSPRQPVPIWVVRVGDDLYVRSYRGHDGAWFRHATAQPQGRIDAGGVDREVTFDRADQAPTAAIDDAYRAKYARYGDAYVQPIISSNAQATTLRLVAR
jgi:hypothetical protein